MAAPRGSEVWRDYVADGIPSSGPNNPKKSDARAWSSWLENLVTSGVLSSGPWFATRAAMTLGYAANTIAIVYNDPMAANNGMYIKVGASGSGAWTQLTSFLPGYQFVTASPTGASTANAIVASTSPRLPSGDGVALVTLSVPHTNTSTPVTVSFDGAPALTIKTRTGENPDAGEMQQNDVVAGFVYGSTFRLISDLNSLRNAQSAKAWANNEEDVPVPIGLGGDGVTTFSAKHWAAKSEQDADRSDDQADRSEVARIGAEAARDLAAGYVNDIVAEKEVPITATRNGMEAIQLPSGMVSLEVRGFAAIGDGGGARYRRISFADLGGFPALAYVRSLDRFTPNGTVDPVNGGYWVIDEKEVMPQMLGAIVDGIADVTLACNAAAALADRIGADLRLSSGKHLFDLANGVALDMAAFAHSHAGVADAALKAALIIPYKVKVRTAGTSTELLFTNLNELTSVGVAITEDGATGAGFSQKMFECEGFMVRAIAGVGRYGIVTPKNAEIFNRKRPKYNFGHVHFCGATDNKTVLQAPNEGWAVGINCGDCHKLNGLITGSGTFLPTVTPIGQHQMTGLKVSSVVGAFGIEPKMIMSAVYCGIDIGDGVEGFSIAACEIFNVYDGIVTSNASGEPGGFIDNVHINAVHHCIRLKNRAIVHIGGVECYKADSYYSDGATAWVGVKCESSETDVNSVIANVADNFQLETANVLFQADAGSVITNAMWRTRGLRRVAFLDGSPDCKIGDGSINNTSGVDSIIDLGNGASDVQGGKVRVRAGSVASYFRIVSGTVDKRRLDFPGTTLIQTARRLEVTPNAGGATTVKPRLTASGYQVAPQAGSGAYTYDLILDRAHAVDGDVVTLKVVGFGSANPTFRVVDDAGNVLRSFTSANAGSGTFWECEFTYSALNNLWRGTVSASSI